MPKSLFEQSARRCPECRALKMINGMIPLTDKSIYIIGPMKLQNALMAFFLQQSTGAKCLALDYFSDIEFIDSENMGQQKLVLFDCLGKDLESLLPELEGNGHRLSSQDLVGLFIRSCNQR